MRFRILQIPNSGMMGLVLQFVKELRLKKLANESSEASAKPETREPEPAKPATVAKPAAPTAPAAAIVLAEALQGRSRARPQPLSSGAPPAAEEGRWHL